jgi:hypothetical protein
VTEISVEIQKKNPINEKEIAPLVKWPLRLPYTFVSVGSPFIEEGGRMP